MIEQSGALVRRAGDRGLETRLDPTPAFRSQAAALSSFRSHARAKRQSRVTVSTEMARASAVSSTLSPAKNRSGNRVYARREVELVLLVKHLLYTEKYTVDGARQKLDEHRRGRAMRPAAREALAREVAETLERDLRDVLDLLEGRRAPRPRADAAAGQG